MMDTPNTSAAKNRRLKLSEAAAYLGVTPSKVSRLIKAGVLKFSVDPFDRRLKLVRVKELERLKRASVKAYFS